MCLYIIQIETMYIRTLSSSFLGDPVTEHFSHNVISESIPEDIHPGDVNSPACCYFPVLVPPHLHLAISTLPVHGVIRYI